MISICKTYNFAAAHQLPNHNGKCFRLHGHNYRVEVEVEGLLRVEGSAEGMVMDFDDLDFAMKPLIELVDHSYLNETLDIHKHSPTAENLALWFSYTLLPELPSHVKLARIRVWETDKCWAEWRAD